MFIATIFTIATRIFIDRRMDKEDLVHVYNGILLSHKNEIMPLAAKWIDPDIIIGEGDGTPL